MIQRIAISGTYSTGKSTTSEALSILTGIPKTEAKTMRELLPDLFPGKMLEECTTSELGTLGLMRFRERISNEAKIKGSFISDGSCLHEWTYGRGRLTYGMNPDKNYLISRIKAIVGFRIRSKVRNFMEIYGGAVKRHAQEAYDVFIHMPIEFSIEDDGHRPLSDRFRYHTEDLILDTLKEIGMKYHTVSGTLEERLEQIVEILSLPTVMSVSEAVKKANSNMEKKLLIIEEKKRRDKEKQEREKSLLKKILYKVAG